MDSIKVSIDREKNTISVQNSGKGIPVEMHKKEGIMIPELIFGNLSVSRMRSAQKLYKLTMQSDLEQLRRRPEEVDRWSKRIRCQIGQYIFVGIQ